MTFDPPPVSRSSPEELALRWVPGEGPVDVQPLASGLLNQIYRVARAGRTYSLRVTGDRSVLDLERDWECRVLACAAGAGIAPQVQCCEPAHGILVLEWVAGRPWTPVETRRPARIRTMAELLRRVHALPIPQPARARGPAEWIADYGAALTRLEAVRAPAPVGQLMAAPPHTDFARADAPGADAPRSAELHCAALACSEQWAAAGAVRAVLCHGDLHRFNVAGGVRPVLLDWEYAHVTDPFWDLAGWIANNDWGDRCAAQLLAGYLARPALTQETARLDVLVWLYDYVCLQWSELCLRRCSGASDRALAARAEQLALRLGDAPGGRAPRVAAH